MKKGTAHHCRSKPWPDQLRKQDVGQTHETVSREQLTTDFDAGLPELVDPSDERRMRDCEVARKLFARYSDHHVLHQRVEKLIEPSVHSLFGRDAEVDIDRGNRMSKRADGDVVHSCFGKTADGFQCNAS